MKKYVKIFAAAAVILAGVSITGCGLAKAVKETLESTYNKWYKYDSNSEITIPVLAYEQEDSDDAAESTTKLKNAEIYIFYNKDDEVFTVAVQSTTSQNVELLNGLYSQSMDVVVGAKNNFEKADMTSTKWTGLVAAYSTLWANGKLKSTSAPKIVTNESECIVLGSENKPKIQWKKFLANYLLGSWLE